METQTTRLITIPLHYYEELIIKEHKLGMLREAWQKDEYYNALSVILGPKQATPLPDPWDPNYERAIDSAGQ